MPISKKSSKIRAPEARACMPKRLIKNNESWVVKSIIIESSMGFKNIFVKAIPISDTNKNMDKTLTLNLSFLCFVFNKVGPEKVIEF